VIKKHNQKNGKGRKETTFEEVFTPLKVRNVTIPNRIVFPAFQTNYATEEGFVTERVLRFYREIAKGGSGLVIVGCVAVSKDGAGATNGLQLADEQHVEGFAKLFSEVTSYGSVAAAQLIHFGRQTLSAITGHPLVAASAIPCPVMQEMPRELSVGEIQRIEDGFATAALRAKTAGAAMVEIHAAFGYLLGGFLSPYSNKRTDNYGGNRENRTRIVREIIEKMRSAISDMPICCRISADEFVDGGLTLKEMKKIAPMLVDAGIDLISVAAGVYQSMNHMVPTKEMGAGVHVPLAAGIKAVVDVPVICAGNILNLELADKIVAEGNANLVAMGRAQVADPHLVKKSKNGQFDEITECDWCNRCMYWITGEPAMSCPKNLEL
jgi:2,4-dienoyl-CoA reductase-like NADH-dependent reductase (Old Yellow Enzyme family)